ncbi:hypothetical protein [Microtetraspora malaysiensis]|uniref:hypothetical protein n=1 Tax=Microtetraspora malaysiensis TaxID=161358 RepID=UPI000AA141DA|nr:hypothetical protein [Microtetraspora malaysiensis]
MFYYAVLCPSRKGANRDARTGRPYGYGDLMVRQGGPEWEGRAERFRVVIGRAIAWRRYVISTVYTASVKPGVNGRELRVGYPKIAAGRGVSGRYRTRSPWSDARGRRRHRHADRSHADHRFPWSRVGAPEKRSHLLGDIL